MYVNSYFINDFDLSVNNMWFFEGVIEVYGPAFYNKPKRINCAMVTTHIAMLL